jgi:hypothetical protein
MFRKICLAAALLLVLSSSASALAVQDQWDRPSIASWWNVLLEWLSGMDKSTTDGGSSPDPDGLSHSGEGGSFPQDPNGYSEGPQLPTSTETGGTDVGAGSDPNG